MKKMSNEKLERRKSKAEENVHNAMQTVLVDIFHS